METSPASFIEDPEIERLMSQTLDIVHVDIARHGATVTL
jgi:hypothetical protein